MVVGLDDSEARRIVVVWGSCWRLLESGREYNLKSIICSDVHTSSIHHHIFIISRYIIPSYAHTYYIYIIYKYIDRVDRISSSPYTYVYIYIYVPLLYPSNLTLCLFLWGYLDQFLFYSRMIHIGSIDPRQPNWSTSSRSWSFWAQMSGPGNVFRDREVL